MTQASYTNVIAVFGGNKPDERELAAAGFFGAQINTAGSVLLTGGDGTTRKTVKDAAISSATEWIGVRRVEKATAPEKKSQSVVVTPGWDHRRNFVEACLCDAAIGIWGGPGTASEVVFCLYLKHPVIRLGDKWPKGKEKAVRDLRDCATHRIGWPTKPQTSIDRAIAGAYE